MAIARPQATASALQNPAYRPAGASNRHAFI